jgi:hypothetical protein
MGMSEGDVKSGVKGSACIPGDTSGVYAVTLPEVILD